ncbi:hypothetical protein JCM21714_875 [Gracilibacillus boraciitolerans JCM 21714]|uniref:Putative amidase domain-containing protein n=1 Tax=Gracilibacillus boraciitolerans JCM 21714 TaxID=1298598 RepID=W4VFI1_9BACI|nr:amidase domain-containing protein [Gracilibacillus boraciitolerans]GAE91906.1 hypothetical protein JCM21714_875 [Gracilibacillus boraciitolerans JCM 21714]
MSEWKELELYWMEKSNFKDNVLLTKRNLHLRCGKAIKQIQISGHKIRSCQRDDRLIIHYHLIRTYFIKDHQSFYHEQDAEHRKAEFVDKQLKTDILLENKKIELTEVNKIIPSESSKRFGYDRRAAVQYAQTWWNDANPAYQYFEDNDCTNYISQCLRAGGAPMHGAPNRSKGWWYNASSWSYSWSVANAFRWYLSGATSGLKGGEELSEPTQLLLGDIICYDFEGGDNKWNHTTIVVAKDDANMPLVNAHTNNSRNRYWTYEDSAAWTPNCKYLFFRIGD